MKQKQQNSSFDSSDREYYLLALRIAGDFGANIAIPVVFFVFLGRAIEQRYGFSPFGMLGGFLLAAVLSGKIIYTKAKKYGEQYDRLVKKE